MNTNNPRLTAFREYLATKDAEETREQKWQRRNRLAKELWKLDCELAGRPIPAEGAKKND